MEVIDDVPDALCVDPPGNVSAGVGRCLTIPDPRLDIVFKDREDYRAHVVKFVEDQESKARELSAGLLRRNAITEEERQAIDLHIVLELSDERGIGAIDLPPIAFRPPIEWAAPTCGPPAD